MKNYPRLAEMGVTHPEQIRKFSVNSINYIDYLAISYERPKGSLLPVTRTYEFPRVPRKSSADAQSGAEQVVMESSPTLRDAVDELQAIVGAKARKQDTVASVREELHRLEEEFEVRKANLEALLDKLDKI